MNEKGFGSINDGPYSILSKLVSSKKSVSSRRQDRPLSAQPTRERISYIRYPTPPHEKFSRTKTPPSNILSSRNRPTSAGNPKISMHAQNTLSSNHINSAPTRLKQTLPFKNFQFIPSTLDTVEDSLQDRRGYRFSQRKLINKLRLYKTSVWEDKRMDYFQNETKPEFVFSRKNDPKKNPERLNLDRKNLQQMPILEGEEKLKLLNYQNNLITKIVNLHNLPSLIFLDLYNNKIKRISGLESVPTLRVLMLGKNCIEKIENLECLQRLDVLDLQQNEIEKIENLSHLKELRVLNLAGNKITVVENVSGLVSLTEINLRRNRIHKVLELDKLHSLQRVFLTNNQIKSFEDVACIFNMRVLMELSMDGNPIAMNKFYRQIVLERISTLRQLDFKRITEEERRIISILSRREKLRRQEQREERKEHPPTYESLPKPIDQPSIKNEQTTIKHPMDRQETQMEGKQDSNKPKQRLPDVFEKDENYAHKLLKEVSKLKDVELSVEDKEPNVEDFFNCKKDKGCFTEMEGKKLYIFGDIEDIAIERFSIAQDVYAQFIPFEKFCAFIPKLKRFPNLRFIQLSHNNITSLNQLKELSGLLTLRVLLISNNPICKLKSILRPFVVNALPQLTHFQGLKITYEDQQLADNLFGYHEQIVKSTCRKNPLFRPNQPLQISKSNLDIAHQYINSVLYHAFTIDAKMKIIDDNWDHVIDKIIIDTLKKITKEE